MEQWLKDNAHLLSIRAIEKEIGCPSTTLTKAANGRMKLPQKWEKPLRDLINKLQIREEQ